MASRQLVDEGSRAQCSAPAQGGHLQGGERFSEESLLHLGW